MLEKQIKIVRFQSRIVIGGPALHTFLLSKKLNNADYSTLLIGGGTNSNEKSMESHAKNEHIRIELIPEMGRAIHFYDDLLSLKRFYKILKREHPDIVHTHTAKAGAIGRIAAFFAGVPFVFHTFHGHVFHGYFGRLKSYFFVLFERILAKFSSAIIVISDSQRKDIVDVYKIAHPKKVWTIPLGFEWDPFEKDIEDFDLRKKFNISEDKYLIGIIGRIVPIKDHRLFLDIAIHLLKREKERFHFIIIGDGEDRQMLESLADRYGITDSVTFTGWQKANRALYESIDLVLLTSKNEGTPVTIIESLVSGTPVVASDVGGVSDIMNYYDPKNLISSREPDDYIQRILEIKDINLKISAEIQTKIKEKYSAERLIRDITRLYSSFLKK